MNLRYILTTNGLAQAVHESDLTRETGVQFLTTLHPHLFGTKESHACPACGWTPDLATKTGMLGCPLCYETVYNRNSSPEV